MNPRCLCCDKPLSPVACFDGGCYVCVGAVWAAALSLRDGSPETIGARVAWCRDNQVEPIATVIVGPLPFAAELERLTDE
jgi:hypothetical protein